MGGLPDQGIVASGQALFEAKACHTCHRPDTDARAPYLENIFGKQVALLDGGTALVDDEYLRESIMNPSAKVVKGYQPIMPTYRGQISEEELLDLINYIKSLSEDSADSSSESDAASSG